MNLHASKVGDQNIRLHLTIKQPASEAEGMWYCASILLRHMNIYKSKKFVKSSKQTHSEQSGSS